MNLPPQLEKYREVIESSKRDTISITTSYDENLGRLDSKLGGEPYWPKSMDYPTHSHRPTLPMLLFAQINFEDLPEQDILPRKGILQFFTTGVDSPSQEDIKVVHHSKIDESNMVEDFEEMYLSIIEDAEDAEDLEMMMDEVDAILDEAFGLVKLNFESSSQCVTAGDYRFASFFGEDSGSFFGKFDDNRSTSELYHKLSTPRGSRIGGYIETVHDDPRPHECPEHKTLLLQLDLSEYSEGEYYHYLFIKPSDLAKQDFSDVHFSEALYI